MTPAEVMTTALTATFLFNNHLDKGREFLLHDKAIPNMLSKSRFNRRLHNISDLLWKAFFEWVSKRNLNKNEATQFIVDTFPIEVCHFVRANRSKIYTEKRYYGYCASKKRSFYGLKAHVITDKYGNPFQLVLTPGSYSDISVLKDLRLKLPIGSELHGDKGYTSYALEDGLRDCANIRLIVARKSNSKRPHTEEVTVHTRKIRKRIETTFGQVVNYFGRNIHAVTAAGFQLKVYMSILVYAMLNCR